MSRNFWLYLISQHNLNFQRRNDTYIILAQRLESFLIMSSIIYIYIFFFFFRIMYKNSQASTKYCAYILDLSYKVLVFLKLLIIEHVLYQFPRAVITHEHKLHEDHKNVFCYGSRGQKSGLRVGRVCSHWSLRENLFNASLLAPGSCGQLLTTLGLQMHHDILCLNLHKMFFSESPLLFLSGHQSYWIKAHSNGFMLT